MCLQYGVVKSKYGRIVIELIYETYLHIGSSIASGFVCKSCDFSQFYSVCYKFCPTSCHYLTINSVN